MIGKIFTLALMFFAGTSSALANCPDDNSAHVDIYPSSNQLPENLLRIYVYFPRPMGMDEGLKNVMLLSHTGRSINGVFLSNREDLWSPDRRRLTLLLDPGRVKTGLLAHEALGHALVYEQSYVLVVSGAALDAMGCPLGEDTQHRFTVAPPDKDRPDPESWELIIPSAHSKQALTVLLGSPHDHLSLAFRLRVVGPNGDVIPGKISLGPREESWKFTPRMPWRVSTYTLTIEDNLEDLAGNRPGALFDQPLNHQSKSWTSRLRFVPKT